MNRRAWFSVGALVGALATAVPAQRLPQTVAPDHYDIHFEPDFATDTFAGRTTIRIRLTQPSRSIKLNAAEIEFHEATIVAGGRTQTASVALDAGEETATLTVPNALPAGIATIAMRYAGQLNDKLRGFYLSRANGREYAITQLEATDARRAFPSFDEPAMKATFSLSATINEGDTAISNGRVLSDTPGPGAGRHTLTFAETKPMSPYLVALMVGDWQCVSGGTDGVPIRICGTPNRKDDLTFALEASEFAIRYLNSYFAIKYPFDKLDIIAVPDFSAGAMENVGAIVFREQYLLVDSGSSTEHRKQVSQYLAHEIAHQWFGDLVTMQWWDDIWLNEGFATWMERRPMEEWKPEWNPRLEEVRDTQGAMNLDALQATRPIRTRVESPQDINQVFDGIAYQKTAAVLRMVEGYVGASTYRDGINAYLKKFAYSNATGEGFWSTMASATGKPVDRILSSFITQGSMPLVQVKATCVGSSTELVVSQKPISSAVPASTVWDIPVCHKRARSGKVDPAACIVVSRASQTTRLEGCSPWVFANVDGRGYYRTSYDPEGLKQLGGAIRTTGLTPVEQTALLEDVWTLVRMNQQHVGDFLTLGSDVLATQSSPAIGTVTDHLNFVASRLVDAQMRPAFERWGRQTLQPLAARLGWDTNPGDSEETQSIRTAVLSTLGAVGNDPDILREARRRVDLHIAGAAPLDPNMFGAAIQLAAINGDAALYDRYLALSSGDGGPAERMAYLTALGSFSSPALRKRTLDYAMSGRVRSQDVPTLLGSMMQSPGSAAQTWDFVKNNWSQLEKTLGIFQGLPAIVGSTRGFCDQAARNDVDAFMRAHPIRGTERTARQSLETIDRCIATKTEQSKNLAEFLARTN